MGLKIKLLVDVDALAKKESDGQLRKELAAFLILDLSSNLYSVDDAELSEKHDFFSAFHYASAMVSSLKLVSLLQFYIRPHTSNILKIKEEN